MPKAFINLQIKQTKPLMETAQRRKIWDGKITKVLNNESKKQNALRNKITGKWKGAKPTFGFNHEREPGKPGSYFFFATVEGSHLARWKYQWLNQGTSVRYATMTKGFKAKTRRRIVSSYPGKGRLAYVDVKQPRPGIKAREWDPGQRSLVKNPEIQRRRGPVIIKAAERAGLSTFRRKRH